ncbi:hypothetical protein NBRC10513_007758 [Rhodotorula toruloides]
MAFKTYMEYKDEPVTQQDLHIATIAFGFIVGFICWSISTAWSQTHKLSVYTVLIWSEIVVCWIFAVICWLYLIGTIQHSFAFFFAILTCWALQVQFLLQIICNRVNLLWGSRRDQAWLKYGVAALISAINVSVYCIWKQLVANGLERYRPLVRFNSRLILLSIAMDVFIIAMMSLRNSFTYMSIHPVAYLVKLQVRSTQVASTV